MVLSASERLKAVVKWYSGQTGKTQRQIGESIGYPREAIFSQFLNGHKEIPKALPSKIASLDPRINIAFLMGESEEMLLPSNVQPDARDYLNKPAPSKSSSGVFLPAEVVAMFTELSATVRSQQETINLLVRAAVKETMPKKDVG